MQTFTSLKKLLRFPKFNPKAMVYPLAIFCLLIPFSATSSAGAGEFVEIKSLIGPNDALVLADPENRIRVSKNKNKKLVPASILKIFTSLAAFHYLGHDYRYPTEIYLDGESNLKIKGFGDPLLISEAVKDISCHLAALIGGSTVIGDLVVDDSFFNRPLTIPGISSSAQPYNAPNGALCVNFNTVFFRHTKSGYISAEDQTPMLPYAEKKIKALNLKSGRFVLSHIGKENTVYAGKLFQHFLKQRGVQFSGTVKPGRVNEAEDKLVYRYVSQFSLEQIISKLLEYSNNFTTNQLFITTGIKVLGPPGNLEKGVAAALKYAADVLQIENFSIVEGSGISRKNRVSAQQMLRILEKFKPYHRLLRKKDREYYKTGTLFGINTRAGYIVDQNSRLNPYVIMINTPGKSTQPVIHNLLNILQ